MTSWIITKYGNILPNVNFEMANLLINKINLYLVKIKWLPSGNKNNKIRGKAHAL